MTIRVQAVESIVIGRGISCPGPVIPDDLIYLPDDRLRVIGGDVVDAATLDLFHVDEFGLRHAVAGVGRSELECAWDVPLILDDDGWRIKNDADLLDRIKAKARTAIIARANTFTAPILSKYPEAERAGWDKREAEARAIIAAGDKVAAIAATNVIKALATASGETAAATVTRAEAIAAKADEFAAISAAVEIMRDTALTAIEAVEAVADMPATLEALKAQATALAAQYGLA